MESATLEMEHVTRMSSDAPTADASHLTGSVIMTTTVATILMSKDVLTARALHRSSDVIMVDVYLDHGNVTMMMTVKTILMRKTAVMLLVGPINSLVITDAVFQNVGFAILTMTVVMAPTSEIVPQRQQQHPLQPTAHLPSLLVIMIAAFQVAGIVMETRTVVMDLMNHKIAPRYERAPQHSSLVKMDAVYPAPGVVMVTMTVWTLPMNSIAFIQLELLLPPNHGPAQPPADRGNLNATTATVSTNGTYAMEPMTVGTTQMNGFVLHPSQGMLPRQPLGHATSGSSAALMGGASTMGTGAMGGTTVETIVTREDVPIPQLRHLRRFQPARRIG